MGPCSAREERLAGTTVRPMSPDLAFILTLALRMAVTAAFVVTASLITERSGPVIGALVATLPISAGPAYVFLALDHDAAFIAEGALASLPINAVTIFLGLTYVVLAQRRSALVSFLGAVAVWIALAALSRTVHWSLIDGLPATAAVIANAGWGLMGLGIAIAVLHVAALQFGSAIALSLALMTCVGWNLVLWWLGPRRLVRRSALRSVFPPRSAAQVRRRRVTAPRTAAGRRPRLARSGRDPAPRVLPIPIWRVQSPVRAGLRALRPECRRSGRPSPAAPHAGTPRRPAIP